MAGLFGSNSSFGMSSLFGNNSSSVLSDWAFIRSGSYKKLMKAYLLKKYDEMAEEED